MKKLLLLAATACIGLACAGQPPMAYMPTDGLANHQALRPFPGALGPYSGRFAPMAPVASPLYRQSRGANTWESGTLADLNAMGPIAELKPVRSESCQWGVNFYIIRIGLDDSSYKAAYLNALRQGGFDTIVDVRADRKIMSVLSGLYTQLCTVINATGVKLQDGSPMKLGPTLKPTTTASR